jgi:hypothetical protein
MLRYEFYLGIVNVVEVTERIRVDNTKTRDLQRNVTGGHGCRFKFRSAFHHADVASSCRSFILQTRLSHFLASDQRDISSHPHKPDDTLGLAPERLNSTLRCSPFLSEPLEQLHDFPRQLICTKHHAPHLLKMWSSFRSTYALQNLNIQYYVHYLTKKKSQWRKLGRKGVSIVFCITMGFYIAVAVIA